MSTLLKQSQKIETVFNKCSKNEPYQTGFVLLPDDTIDIYKVLRFHKSNAINFSPIQCTILIFNQYQIYHQKFKQPSKPLCLLQQLPFCYQLFKPQLLNQHSRIIQRHRLSLQLNQYRLMQLTNQHQKHRAQHCHSVSFFFHKFAFFVL